jgi:hypothetical protein
MKRMQQLTAIIEREGNAPWVAIRCRVFDLVFRSVCELISGL